MQNQIVLCIQFTCVLTLWLSGSATLRVVAHQAPLSMRFSRQEYWSGLPFPPPVCFRSVSAAEGAACSANLSSLLFLGNETPVLFRWGCAKSL